MAGLLSVTRIALGIGILVVVAMVCYRKAFRRSNLPLPPGPKGEPILGHLRLIPESHPEYQLTEWGKEYSMSITALVSFVLP